MTKSQEPDIPLVEGFAGTVGMSFFRLPKWIDASKPPGHTPQAMPSWPMNILKKLTGYELIFSPNLIWLAIAAALYVAFPFDYEAAAEWRAAYIWKRFLITTLSTFGFFGFWHLALYSFRPRTTQTSKRKFKGVRVNEDEYAPEFYPGFARMGRNLWYCFLACVQMTFWEVAFVHIYATGKLPYLADEDITASGWNLFRFVAGIVLVPIWRSTHFYFAHRFLHIRAVYKFVHSLHHRNIDIEPFSGLTMHVVEHLYYYSCVGPSLYLFGSPFHAYWNMIHLMISPAASHSGWEDHWQSDQHHFTHHAKFECNYGTSDIPLDAIFGTYREVLTKSETYKGEWTEQEAEKLNQPSTAAEPEPFHFADLFPIDIWHFLYHAHYVFLCFTLWATLSGCMAMTPAMGRVVAAMVSMGPLVVAVVLALAAQDRFSLRWPFHKEPVIGTFGFHLVLSFLATVVPTYHFIESLYVPAEETAYCRLWGC